MERHELDDLSQMYADISASLLALVNALDGSGVLSREKIAEAFQERLLAMQPAGKPDDVSPYRFPLLREFATGVQRAPRV